MKKLFTLFFILIALSKLATAQTVTITAPNGGEVLAVCQSFIIAWPQAGSPSNSKFKFLIYINVHFFCIFSTNLNPHET